MKEDLRVLLAALAAILAPAMLGTVILAMAGGYWNWSGMALGFGIGCVIAFLHLFFLGWPAWFAMSRRMPMRWWNAGGLGLVVGLAPAALLSILLAGPRVSVRDWQDTARILLFCAACGASAGLSVRAVRGVDPRLGTGTRG